MYNLIFDMGGVLMDLNMPGCVAALTKIMDGNKVKDVLGLCPNGEGMTDSLMEGFECGTVSENDFLQAMLEIAKPGTTADDIRQAWVTLHGGIQPWKMEQIRQFKSQGHHILLLSNNNDIHMRDIVTNYDMSAFDQCFYSNVVHSHKPERGIYEAVQTYLKGQGWDELPTFFVDDIPANREVGDQMGWRTFDSISALVDFLNKQ